MGIEKRDEAITFKAGSFVVLLKLTGSFGKYLARLCASFVKLQKATISIDHVKDLLNMPTQRSFKDSGSHRHQNYDDALLGRRNVDCIEVRDLFWEAPGDGPQSMTYMKPLQMLKGKVVKIPLFKVVRISGPSDGLRLTFMALVAKVMHPLQGEVRCSPSAWSIMLPPKALGAPPGMTVQEAMALGGNPEHFTSRFPPHWD